MTPLDRWLTNMLVITAIFCLILLNALVWKLAVCAVAVCR